MDGIFESVDFGKEFEIDDTPASGEADVKEPADTVETPEIDTADAEGNESESNSEKENKDEEESDKFEIPDDIINDDTTDNSNTENNNQEQEDSAESESNENEESPLTTYATALKEEGVLPNLNLEDFDGTVEGLIEAQRKQFEDQVEEYKETLPQEVKDIIDNYEQGVPLTDLINAKSKEIEYGSITEEAINSNKETQKRLIRDLLKSKGIKEVRIDRMIDSFDNTGSLAEEALLAKEELVEIQADDIKAKKELQKENAKKYEAEQKAQMDSVFNTINDTEEIVPGMKLNKTMREKIFKNMIEPAGVDDKGNQISKVMKIRGKDPLAFDVTLNYLAELGVFEGKWDKIVSKQKSKAIKELEKKITSKQTSLSNKPIKTKRSEDIIDSMKRSFGKNFR